jgi:hypothetical protein
MSGPGNPGPCTAAAGFLAYGEIEYMIESRGLNPVYNSTSKTMTLVDGNQWIGYEDAATLATKLKYVLDRTMPGVLIWAVDLDRSNKLLSAVRILFSSFVLVHACSNTHETGPGTLARSRAV